MIGEGIIFQAWSPIERPPPIVYEYEASAAAHMTFPNLEYLHHAHLLTDDASASHR